MKSAERLSVVNAEVAVAVITLAQAPDAMAEVPSAEVPLAIISVALKPLAFSVVKLPAAAAVPPIAGGEAKYVLKPVPLTVEVADSVVKAPAAGAEPPMAGGLAR